MYFYSSYYKFFIARPLREINKCIWFLKKLFGIAGESSFKAISAGFRNVLKYFLERS